MENSKDNIHEKEINWKQVALFTTCFYPHWSSEERRNDTEEEVRGKLALNTIEKAVDHGLNVVVVDGGSSGAFIESLNRLKVNIVEQNKVGMSASRREALIEAVSIKNVKCLIWSEPEKVSLVNNCLPLIVKPILRGEADIVIPKRDENSWLSYPMYQKMEEKRGNITFNSILRKSGLLPNDIEDLDVFFGPRIIKNDPRVISLFLEKYKFIKDKEAIFHKYIDVDAYSNFLFLPIVAALKEGLKVVSVTVPYVHPKEQTKIELEEQIKYGKKRVQQRHEIITAVIHFIRFLNGGKETRLYRSGDE